VNQALFNSYFFGMQTLLSGTSVPEERSAMSVGRYIQTSIKIRIVEPWFKSRLQCMRAREEED
jgi:hypothetical protein